MVENLEIGRTHQLRKAVAPEDTADRFGNPRVMVLATPMLVALVEQAAIECVAPALEPGQITVGTHIDLKHLAATPVGMTVTVRARLAGVDGRKLTFEVEAFDEQERICECVQERFVVGLSRFLERATAKAGGG